ncbi:MAG: putative methyltransferase [Gammaproteobacteria bacterium]|jgi:predicted methyltransferase
MKLLTMLTVAMLLCVPGIAVCESMKTATVDGAINLNLNHPSRSDKEKARDKNRMPNETLAFFGLKDDMQVIELFPGGGWYTKLLGPFLADKGALFIALGTDDLEPNLVKYELDKVRATGTMENFTKTDAPGYIFSIDSIDLQRNDVDMVLTFRNAHNLNSAARTTLNRAVFAALKPGGIYGVIDHTKRHMEELKKPTWRRTDPVQIIQEALDVGFELVNHSNIHRRPEDELLHDTRHDSLVNESDRYTLKFRKPE